jgi:hypothetical protein
MRAAAHGCRRSPRRSPGQEAFRVPAAGGRFLHGSRRTAWVAATRRRVSTPAAAKETGGPGHCRARANHPDRAPADHPVRNKPGTDEEGPAARPPGLTREAGMTQQAAPRRSSGSALASSGSGRPGLGCGGACPKPVRQRRQVLQQPLGDRPPVQLRRRRQRPHQPRPRSRPTQRKCPGGTAAPRCGSPTFTPTLLSPAGRARPALDQTDQDKRTLPGSPGAEAVPGLGDGRGCRVWRLGRLTEEERCASRSVTVVRQPWRRPHAALPTVGQTVRGSR